MFKKFIIKQAQKLGMQFPKKEKYYTVVLMKEGSLIADLHLKKIFNQNEFPLLKDEFGKKIFNYNFIRSKHNYLMSIIESEE
jgi:hypothetical protein